MGEILVIFLLLEVLSLACFGLASTLNIVGSDCFTRNSRGWRFARSTGKVQLICGWRPELQPMPASWLAMLAVVPLRSEPD